MATVNNNWPTPVATDLVKDGWEAIKDLGDAIDTTLGVYAPSTSGLELINTTSFSGVSSQSINDVFSATYDNYAVQLELTDGGGLTMRLRVSATDNSSSNYYWGRINVTSDAGVVAKEQSTTSATSFSIGQAYAAFNNRIINVFSPFLAKNTSITYATIEYESSVPRSIFKTGGGFMTVSTSYTGFTILGSNLTGTVSVYGYNK
jgi:hypothetical protein